MTPSSPTTDSQLAVEEAELGSFDGVVSVVGFVFALLAQGVGTRAIAIGGLGGAVSATVSMTFGDYQSSEGKPRQLRFRMAAYMAVGTLIGSLVPSWGFWIFPRAWAIGVGGVGCLAVAAWIGWAKRRGWRGYVNTFVTLTAAIGITMLIISAIPGSAG